MVAHSLIGPSELATAAMPTGAATARGRAARAAGRGPSR